MNPKWFHHLIGKKTFAGVKERRYGLISSEMIYRWWIPQPTRQLFWARPRTPPGNHILVPIWMCLRRRKDGMKYCQIAPFPLCEIAFNFAGTFVVFASCSCFRCMGICHPSEMTCNCRAASQWFQGRVTSWN